MSDLILNLNEPNQLGDVSWVKPSKYVGVWWGMHLATESWAPGPTHGATTANTKRYIDFAAKHGFRGVLVEGWNKGWDGDWFANGETSASPSPIPISISSRSPPMRKAKGVHLIGHHETSGNIAQLREAARRGAGSVRQARRRQREDRLCRRCRRRAGDRSRRQPPLRVARRPGDVASSSEGRHRGGASATSR